MSLRPPKLEVTITDSVAQSIDHGRDLGRRPVVVSTNRLPAQLEVELSWVRH